MKPLPFLALGLLCAVVTVGKPLVIQMDDNGEVTQLIKRGNRLSWWRCFRRWLRAAIKVSLYR